MFGAVVVVYLFVLGVVAFLLAGLVASAVVAALIGLLGVGGGMLRRGGDRNSPIRTDTEARRERITLTVAVVLLAVLGVSGVLLLTFS
jgi:hypothetical protein